MAINYGLLLFLVYILKCKRFCKFHCILLVSVLSFAAFDYWLCNESGLVDVFTLFVDVPASYTEELKANFDMFESPFYETYYLLTSMHMVFLAFVYLFIKSYICKIAFFASMTNALVNVCMLFIHNDWFLVFHSAVSDIIVVIEVLLAWIATKVEDQTK